MKHAVTREMFAYWDKCRGVRAAPERADIEPAALRRILANTFLLSFDITAGHPFRLAGTGICALFGREMKNGGLLDLWEGSDRTAIANLVTVLAAESVGIVANASGHAEQALSADLELLMLPLHHHERPAGRVIGTLTPIEPAYWHGARPLRHLTLGPFRHVGPTIADAAPRFRASAPPLQPASRQMFGLTVYEGGRRE